MCKAIFKPRVNMLIASKELTVSGISSPVHFNETSVRSIEFSRATVKVICCSLHSVIRFRL
jgi:hypothetical protein